MALGLWTGDDPPAEKSGERKKTASSTKKRSSNAVTQLPMPGAPLRLPSSWTAPTEFPRLSGVVGFDLETKDPDLKKNGPGWAFPDAGYIVGFSFAWDGGRQKGYWPIRHHGGGNLDEGQVLSFVRDTLAQNDLTIVAHNASYELGWLKREGIDCKAKTACTYTTAALLDEYRRSYSLDRVSEDYLGVKKDESLLMNALAAYGLPGKDYIWSLPATYVGPYAEQDAVLALRLWETFQEKIKRDQLEKVIELEFSLIPLLVEMRYRGIRIDMERAQNAVQVLQLEYDEFLLKVEKRLGQKLDIWTPDSIVDACFRMKEDYPKTARGGPSFQQEWLENHTNPVLRSIPKLRTLDKMRGTFIDSYFLQSCVNGRLHAQFHPLRADDGGTVSGRCSSSNPNLQNLPSPEKSAFGKVVRGFLLPEEGHSWATLDYSQQEPRMAVHFATLSKLRGAEAAAKAYRDNPSQDFHQLVADLAGISRKEAKVINLGMLYGMGGGLLCQSLGLPVVATVSKSGRSYMKPGPEGEALIRQYHLKMPWIRGLQDAVEGKAEQRGYIRTLQGRRCRFGEGKDFARKALNRLIQGSSADQTKLAMLHNWREYGLVPLVQVHDELGYSVASVEEARLAEKGMIECVELLVPSKVDLELGPNWGDVSKAA